MQRAALPVPNLQPEPGTPAEKQMHTQIRELEEALMKAGASNFYTDLETFVTVVGADDEDGHIQYQLFPGEWVVFNRAGVFRTRSVPANELPENASVVGFNSGRPADIWESSITLRWRPWPGKATVRMVSIGGHITYGPADWDAFHVIQWLEL